MLSNQSGITKSFMLQAIEIAYAAPQVIAHRVSRMALAGLMPSTRDRNEFQLMGLEKWEATVESWNAMALATSLIIRALANQYATSMMVTFQFTEARAQPSTIQFSVVGPSILSKAIAPIHRRVMDNAKRLRRTRRTDDVMNIANGWR